MYGALVIASKLNPQCFKWCHFKKLQKSRGVNRADLALPVVQMGGIHIYIFYSTANGGGVGGGGYTYLHFSFYNLEQM